MDRWGRFLYNPVLPLGEDGRLVTNSHEHRNLARLAAQEGCVLLKNQEEILPFRKDIRIAVCGMGCVDYVKGGGGSGDVTTNHVHSLLDALEEKEKEGKIHLYAPLAELYRKCEKNSTEQPGYAAEPEIPDTMLADAAENTDAALFVLSRHSSEGCDRRSEDYYLSEQERKIVEQLKKHFHRIVVVLNIGSVIDTSWFHHESLIQGALLIWQGGAEGCPAAADILCGDSFPSGKLADTFASQLEDYPSMKNYQPDGYEAVYEEDIFVGYRYFETIPGAKKRINYPFGYGLSYTHFQLETISVHDTLDKLSICVKVSNLGSNPGKEVVQLYVSAPDGYLSKPAMELKGFVKTKELAPGEAETVSIELYRKNLASYDDFGKRAKSAWVLEPGKYTFWIGSSIDTLQLAYTWLLEQCVITEQKAAMCVPQRLMRRLTPDGTYESVASFDPTVVRDVPAEMPANSYWPGCKATPPVRVPWEEGALDGQRPQFTKVAEGAMSLDTFIQSLDCRELAELVCGQANTGVADTAGIGNLPQSGIPNIMTADGPAGLRITPNKGIFSTAWPCATMLACTFNPVLVEAVGRSAAMEVKENNIGIWLAPAVNIHRNPLCGRNFEYYSEDPLLSGKMGAAMIRGIQSVHISAALKHFACNNTEVHRMENDSIVSERALREIYLRSFEIAIQEGSPWIIMSSYNLLNGHRTSENSDLLIGILRNEWGYDGLVITDWWNHANHIAELKAENDVRMPIGDAAYIEEAINLGILTKEKLSRCAKRVLDLILKLD